MKVMDVMSREFFAVSPDTSVVVAARLIVEKQIDGLAVVDERGRLVGVLTVGDLLRRTEFGNWTKPSGWRAVFQGAPRRAADDGAINAVRTADVMTRHPLCCRLNEDLRSVAQLMIERNVKRLYVLDRARPVGVVSRAEVVGALVEAMVEEARVVGSTDEADLERRIRHALSEETPAVPRSVSVQVHDGTVVLSGAVRTRLQRDGIRTAIEREAPSLPIVDQMVLIEPGATTGPELGGG